MKEVADLGVQVGVVIGGGNIFRGVSLGAAGMDRATADYMVVKILISPCIPCI